MRMKPDGMSLVELMIAMAIGTIISLAMTAIFVSTTKAKHEVNRLGEQIENGRIAMEWLSRELNVAGFWDSMEFVGMADPTLPDICATAVSSLASAVPVYIQGLDNVASATPASCLSDVKTGTDVLVVRRAGTCVIGASGCESVAPYFQASKCTPPADKLNGTTGVVALGAELGDSVTPANWYGVAATTGALTLHKRDCGNASLTGAPNLADIRRYLVRIYYIANNDVSGDALPSLKMVELRGTTWTASTIAAGIEEMHIEYGQTATSDTADTLPASYVTAPATTVNWRRITTIKMHLLSRNSSATPQYSETKTYVLGKRADGTDNSFGPFSDSIRRHTFSGLVELKNPVGLRGG